MTAGESKEMGLQKQKGIKLCESFADNEKKRIFAVDKHILMI